MLDYIYNIICFFERIEQYRVINDNVKVKQIKQKKALIFDGDNVLTAKHLWDEYYREYTKEYIGDIFWIAACETPRDIRIIDKIQSFYLKGFRVGKENSDKMISILIGSLAAEGYKEIEIVSNDNDFIEIAEMANHLYDNDINFFIVKDHKQRHDMDKPYLKENVSNINVKYIKKENDSFKR